MTSTLFSLEGQDYLHGVVESALFPVQPARSRVYRRRAADSASRISLSHFMFCKQPPVGSNAGYVNGLPGGLR